MTVARRLLAALSVAVGLAGWGSTAHADWAACQRQLTRTCLLEEALRGDGAPLTGKDRLEVLIWAGAAMHPEYATDADIDEAVREVKSAPTGAKYEHISLGYSWLAADARASLLSVAAFRGDVESVRAGLQHLPTDGTADIRVYPKVVPALVQAKQFALALEIAKSAPASVRDWMLATVSAGNAANGRIDDARAVLTLLSDKAGAERRVAVVRSIAAAMVKTGKVAAAVEMAGEVSDPKGRKAVLFTIAQELPQ